MSPQTRLGTLWHGNVLDNVLLLNECVTVSDDPDIILNGLYYDCSH